MKRFDQQKTWYEFDRDDVQAALVVYARGLENQPVVLDGVSPSPIFKLSSEGATFVVEEEERPHGATREALVFSSGRRIIMWGSIGLDPVSLALHYGYDGTLDREENLELTDAERVELARFMIEKWQTVIGRTVE